MYQRNFPQGAAYKVLNIPPCFSTPRFPCFLPLLLAGGLILQFCPWAWKKGLTSAITIRSQQFAQSAVCQSHELNSILNRFLFSKYTLHNSPERSQNKPRTERGRDIGWKSEKEITAYNGFIVAIFKTPLGWSFENNSNVANASNVARYLVRKHGN